jgi:outer membrane receptor protein involved in Fe transport
MESFLRKCSTWIRFSLLVPALAVAALLMSGVTFAQTTGTIEGTITDQSGGSLPGVSVAIHSPALQGSRVATTGADGRFRFPALPPGSYRVTATLSGFTTVEKTAVVSLDATATVKMAMQVSAKEEVVVTGEAPLVDTTSTTTGTTYTAKVIDKLPVGRNYADIVLSQPGVQTDSGETQGRSLALSIYGSTSSENLFLIDGVNTTNVIKGFQGKAINPEFIQEVEVKTGGYQAEYGRNTGGVINVITKSGGNEFHGDGFSYFYDTGMRSNQKFNETAPYSQSGDARAASVLTRDNRFEAGADLGGYFIKDRIWFFGAYDRTKTDTDVQPQSGVVALQKFPDNFTTSLYSGKLTFNILQGSTLIGTIFADPQVEEGAISVPAGTNPNTYNGRRDTGGTDYAVRFNQLFGSVGILTLQYGRHKDRYNTKPGGVTIPQVLDYSSTAFGGVLERLNGFGEVFGPTINNASKRDSYSGSFTAYVQNHEVKVGVDYQKDDTFGSTFFTGGQRLRIRPCTQTGSSVCDLSKAPTYTNDQGQTIPVFYQHDYFAANGTDLTPLVTSPFDTPSKRLGLYLQDNWRIIPSLTVNAGIRYDNENIIKGNGQTAFKLNNEWAPRFGFVWDFVGDGTSKVYGSAGRFYYALPTDLNVRVFTANSLIGIYNYDPNSLQQDPTAPRNKLVQVGSFAGEPVDPGLKAAYEDELTLGVEKAIDPTLSVGLKYTYRTLGRTIEDRCDLDYSSPLTQFNSCALMNPGSNGPAASGKLPGCDGSGNPTDPNAGTCTATGTPVPEARRLFRGIELTARKQFSNTLWAQASYLYSTLRGNYSGAIRESSGQTDPGINADYDYHQFLTNAYGNLELDRPHQFRLDTVWSAPFGLVVGLQAYVRSGTPTSRDGWFNNFYNTELFLDPRGSDGRLPTEYEANLSLAYNARIGPVTITPQLYIFNLLNKQIVTSIDQNFNPNATFVTNPASQFYGQAGVEPGTAGPDGVVCTSSKPCPDNQDYRKATARTAPRLFQAAIKISF